MSRLVIIDDTNPSIQYNGPWFEAANKTLPQIVVSVGGIDNGPPFQNTLHGVNVTANLSFNFSGSAVVVYGTSNTTNVSGTQDPTWECFVDSTSIGSSFPSSVFGEFGGSENNWVLCGAGPAQIQDGPHLLTVNANVSEQTFWFDQIQYAPSANVSLNQSLLRIDSMDSAIQYSPAIGWLFLDGPINYKATPFGNASLTDTNEAFLTYEFSGTSISLYGAAQYPNLTNANATYTIDNQEPTTFSVGSSSTQNQMLFDIGQLSPGQHKLVVTYLGNNDTQHLVVDYFAQVQLDAPSSITPSSSNSSPGKPTDAIVGGVIGGLVLISLLIALFFLHRRNNRRSKALPSPFTLSPSNPTSTFQPHNSTSNGQSPQSAGISSKFSHRNQPSDPASTSNGGEIPPLTPLRTQLDPSQRDDARLLWHEDSGVRIPSVEGNILEFPPLYTSG